MDAFMNLAKKGLDSYTESQQQSQPQSHQGHQQQRNDDNYDDNDDSYQGQGQGQSQGRYNDTRHHESAGVPDIDQDDVVNRAQQHAGDSGSSDLFSSAMSHLSNRKNEQTQPVDEEHVTRAHNEAYSNGNASNLDSGSLGAAAAMQALKKFTSGSSGTSQSGGTSQLISLAMGEASKLFESSGGSANKQDTINSAAMTMMKLVVQSKFSGGSSSAGGLGGILSMAQKFM